MTSDSESERCMTMTAAGRLWRMGDLFWKKGSLQSVFVLVLYRVVTTHLLCIGAPTCTWYYRVRYQCVSCALEKYHSNRRKVEQSRRLQ